MGPGHRSEVKQVLKCVAVQKCRDLIRILLLLTGISDLRLEREHQEKLILGVQHVVWIPVLPFSKQFVSRIGAYYEMSIPGLQNSLGPFSKETQVTV